MPDIERAVQERRLPRVALDVAQASGFQSAKTSIFMYGWASGNVTLTSNKEVRGQIRTLLEANRHDDEEMGPKIWRLDVTRNLLAKAATPPWLRERTATATMTTTTTSKESAQTSLDRDET